MASYVMDVEELSGDDVTPSFGHSIQYRQSDMSEMNQQTHGASGQMAAPERVETELELRASSGVQGLLSPPSDSDSDVEFNKRVWSKVCKAISKRVHDQHQVSISRTSVSRTPPQVYPVQALNTQNLQALLDYAQELRDRNTEVAGKAKSHEKKRDLDDSSESDSDSDQFMDKKRWV